MTRAPRFLRALSHRYHSSDSGVGWLLALAIALFCIALFMAPADAQDGPWIGYFDWRGERVRVVSDCGRVAGGGILRELETGYQRASRDLPELGGRLPKLGTPGWPYTIVLSRLTNCPGGAIACSTTPAASAPRWGTMKALCGKGVPRLRRGVRAVDHEVFHRWCALLRPHFYLRESEAERVKACNLADHPAGPGERWDVLGRRVKR